MTPGERCLVVAVMCFALALCVVKWIGEWINGGWHWTKHKLRRLRHRWEHRHCRKPPTK